MGVGASVGAGAQFGIEGSSEGGVGYGTSAIGATTSESVAIGGGAEYNLGGQTTTKTTTTTTTTTTTNIEGDNGLVSTIQPGFLPSAYESTVQNPLEQIPA